MNTTAEALSMVLAMGAVVVFCRALPFLFFSREGEHKKGRGAFLDFVERVVPPVAMTVLAFNALGGAFRDGLANGLPALAAAAVTAVLHLWKGNYLVSILGGTILYMIIFPG